MTTPDRDIVDRLRERTINQTISLLMAERAEAATEINRLRALIYRLGFSPFTGDPDQEQRTSTSIPFTDGTDRDMEPTPEMVEAGLKELYGHPIMQPDGASMREAVMDVYKAMEGERRRGHQSRET